MGALPAACRWMTMRGYKIAFFNYFRMGSSSSEYRPWTMDYYYLNFKMLQTEAADIFDRGQMISFLSRWKLAQMHILTAYVVHTTYIGYIYFVEQNFKKKTILEPPSKPKTQTILHFTCNSFGHVY